METIIPYLSFSISIIFISWIVGMVLTALVRNNTFYHKRLSHLNFIKSDSWNAVIGIDVIKWIIKNTFFKFFNQKLKIHRKATIADLNTLRSEMTKSEIDHLFAFGFVMVFVIVKIINNQYVFALIILVVNALMNLYPSLLQQQNKRRIDRLIVILQK